MGRGGIHAGRGFVPLPFRGASGAGFPSGPYGQRDIRDVRAARLLNDPRGMSGPSSSNRPLSIYDHQRSGSGPLPPQSLSPSSSMRMIPGQDPRFRGAPQEGFLPSSTPPYSSFKKQRTRELSPPPRYSSRPPSPPPTVGLYPPYNPFSRFA